jgi:hypothetical protein
MNLGTNLGGTGTSLSSCKPFSGSLRVYYGGCGSLGILGRLYVAVALLARINVPSALAYFETIITAALQAYNKQTKKDIASHPLATQLRSCESPSAILAVLRTQVQTFDQSQSADEKLTKWLDPTVNVLYAFSATLGNGVGLVSDQS